MERNIISDGEVVRETVSYLSSVWDSSLQPLIDLPIGSPGTKGNQIAAYDVEFPIESLGDDGVDTLSVRRAVTEILGDEQAPERLIVRLSEWVVREINACMIQDPPEPATPKLKDELLGEYVDNEDVMGYHLDDGLPLKIEAYFDPNNTHDIRHKYAEIDAIVREIDRLDKRNNLIASLWSLPIDELHEDSGLQMEEEEWLDKIDADGEVRFFGPNYYEEESEIEEEYDLPMSVSEKFFKNKLPHYFNDRLLPHAYIADISDTSTHIQIMRKIFMRKSLIYLYAQNNPPRGRTNKKQISQYNERLEKLHDEIMDTMNRIFEGD